MLICPSSKVPDPAACPVKALDSRGETNTKMKSEKGQKSSTLHMAWILQKPAGGRGVDIWKRLLGSALFVQWLYLGQQFSHQCSFLPAVIASRDPDVQPCSTSCTLEQCRHLSWWCHWLLLGQTGHQIIPTLQTAARGLLTAAFQLFKSLWCLC